MNFHTKDISQHNFLVTGGAGFIGSHIVAYLLKNGANKVRVLDNFSNGFQQNLEDFRQSPAFELVEGDIRNAEVCNGACRDIHYVSHQAALGSVPRSINEPVYFNEVNVGGFVNMLKAAADNGVRQFVYASSSSVYGDEPTLPKVESRVGNCLSPYAATKKANELYAQVFADVYGIKIMGFRYFNIFGPGQDPDGAYAAVIPLFVKAIINKTPVFINGDGEQTRDFTFVDNAVQVNIRGMLIDNPAAQKQVFNVATGENFSVNYLYAACQKQLHSDFEASYRAPRQGDIRNSLADISLARELLGYQPATNFEDGLVKTIEFFKNRYSAGA
jgi:UDP-N-acetylglucosamine 4-epimerase